MCMIEIAINDKRILKDIVEAILKPALYSSKILLNIINNILDLSRLNAQKLSLHF